MSVAAKTLVIGLLVSLFAIPAPANIIHVPADQPTIQAGINAAITGDTVLVSAGTYYENINFNGKAITVTSASGPVTTIIDGSKQQYNQTISFSSGETNTSVLSGFTIQGGYNAEVSIYSSSPTMQGNVIITSPTQSYFSTGISIWSGAPIIQGNLLAGNQQAISTNSDNGVQIVGNVVVGSANAGISLSYSNTAPVVQQNTIIGNAGGFSYYSFSTGITFVQNLVTSNLGIGVSISGTDLPVTMVSNTISDNQPEGCCNFQSSEVNLSSISSSSTLQNNLIIATGAYPAFYCYSYDSAPVFTNNDVFAANTSSYSGACPDMTGTNGNISADPVFVNLLADNFHIQSSSPAIGAGTTAAGNEPGQDFDGDPRSQNGAIDIGADEYAANQALALSTYALHFGSQIVGTSSNPQTVSLTNHSNTAATLYMIATGPNFTQTNNCGTSLAAGASCKINVVFSPAKGGSLNTALGIFTSATVNPQAVTLIGTGLAPQVQLPCCFYFFNQVIGTSNTQTGNLTNTGQAPLAISSIAYSGSSDFAVTNNCPIAPSTLAPGASCTITVVFTPTIVGNESGTITFNDNAQPSPQTLTVSGSSVSAGVPTLNPTSLTFPTTLIGQSSPPQTATLTNTGTGALGITNIYSYGDFPATNNCPSSLAVGGSCTITVTFTPSRQGSDFGFLQVYTDSAYFIVELSMSGTGQAPVPTISSLSISSVPTGSANTQITVTGTGFVYGSQVLMDGFSLGYSYVYGNTQISATIPASNLTTSGTYQISVFTPTPGGGTSNSLPFTVYSPINYAAKSTTYNYRTITGTNLNLNYYSSAQVTSPFPIQFGGGSFTNLTVGPGGTVSFSGFASENNDVIPTSQTSTLVAPFWASLYPFGFGNDNNVFWQVLGTAPNRQLVIEWRDVGICCEAQNTIKFEVVFFEGSANIVFNYADTIFGGLYSNDDNGATASSGVQVASGLGTQFSYYQPNLKSQTALLWYPGVPTATLSTNNLQFGYHQIGSKSLGQKVTLTNGSAAPLQITSIATDNSDYSFTTTCGTTLAPQAHCAIHVFFTPSQPTTETANLIVTDNAQNSPQTASLTGTGTITKIVVFPIMANFGSVNVGSSATVPVVLANAGNHALTIQQITTTPSVFTQTNTCGSSVAPGASCTVNVTFTPVQQGNVTGKLSMALNGKPLTTETKLVGSGQ